MRERTSPRHPTFDYRAAAAYFVTVCTHERQRLFGRVRRGRMQLNDMGLLVVEEWKRSETLRDEVILDVFVVMPNHLHGIVCLVPPDVDDVSPSGYRLDVGPDPTQLGKASTRDADAIDPRGVGGGGEETPDDQNDPNDDVGTHRHGSLRGRDDHLRWENGRPHRHPRSLGSMIAGFKSAATTRINPHRGTPGAPVWQGRYHDRILRDEREWRACRRYIEQNPGCWGEDRCRSNR